ncbi:hypothetical protein CBI30_03895 [Polynucleobacter aenigmaticus]|uniref:Uncharacterized protein n=2 Tax=Polynucleobacter aenigmaticus TaxID=1743164 RepID=A0A254PZM9_9BURK|nr:hypothetical protein CBI30_03895 [Polynucleobacter aenigmaticus]
MRSKAKYGSKIILDICDNHFIFDETNLEAVKKSFQLKAAIAQVDHLIVSSNYLRDRVTEECGANIEITIIGDLVEEPNIGYWYSSFLNPIASLQYFKLKYWLQNHTPSKKTRLVWFGNHGGNYSEAGMVDLLKIKDLLHDLHKKFPLSLTVVSNSRKKYDQLVSNWYIPTFYTPWNRNNFSRIIKLHSTTVIPITPNKFTLSKTENRVTTALAHGLQVVADEIPSYTKFSQYTYLNQWQDGLVNCFGERGRSLREFDFSHHNQAIAFKWFDLFDSL